MGLIKAFFSAVGGTFADQWKEFFYCEDLGKETLMTRGKRQTGKGSSNKRGHDNIISQGSGIAVADGQCMIIVEQGKVVEFCAEPGEYTYDQSTEPSLFYGGLGKGILNTFDTIGKRFTYGGDTAKDQRIYYFNLKEILDNKFGTPNPIPFRIVDRNINLDIDVSVRCSGVYSYKITDPILFYTNVCGNVSEEYNRREIDEQLRTEFVSALQPAFAQISAEQVRPNEIPAHAQELSDKMNAELTSKWAELRGLTIVSIAMNPITLTDEDAAIIKEAQRAAINRDATMAAATLTEAQAEAMRDAANNANGAPMAFMGMGMAAQAGGGNTQNLFQMGQQQAAAAGATARGAAFTGDGTAESVSGAGKEHIAAPGDTWTCACGTVNTGGKFCTECGKPKPAPAETWTCTCGTVNTGGKFCTECGKPKPER